MYLLLLQHINSNYIQKYTHLHTYREVSIMRWVLMSLSITYPHNLM